MLTLFHSDCSLNKHARKLQFQVSSLLLPPVTPVLWRSCLYTFAVLNVNLLNNTAESNGFLVHYHLWDRNIRELYVRSSQDCNANLKKGEKNWLKQLPG